MPKNQSESDSSSSDEATHHAKKKQRKQPVVDTFTRDRDQPALIVPTFAYDGAKRDEMDAAKASARKKRFFSDYEASVEAIKEQKTAEPRYDPLAALGATEPEITREEAWEASEPAVSAPEDPLLGYDVKTGKPTLKREPDVRLVNDLSMIPADGTVVVAGIRRSGKSWALRAILYHMRHVMSKGIIFSATKFNGWWRQHVPDAYIHEEFDGDVVDAFLKWRAKAVEEYQRDFGDDARDEQNYFIILDDCVDQQTRYFDVRTLLHRLQIAELL
jgi:hypothetical protein